MKGRRRRLNHPLNLKEKEGRKPGRKEKKFLVPTDLSARMRGGGRRECLKKNPDNVLNIEWPRIATFRIVMLERKHKETLFSFFSLSRVTSGHF